MELAPRLLERGHEVIVYNRRSVFKDRPKTWKGVQLIYLPSIETKVLGTPTHTALCVIDVLFRNVDVMLIVNIPNAFHCVVPRLFRKKVALNVDGLDWKRAKWGPVGRAFFYVNALVAGKILPDGIITDAVGMQRIYRDDFKTPSACIAYGANIERSTDPDAVRRYGLEPGQYYLIASRLVPENNADLIVQGFSHVKTDKLLAIAGNANYKSNFIDRLKRTTDPRVKFLGHVGSVDDVRELHCNCYAYLHGHSLGGTNPSLVKALGYGNCIVALDTVFNSEVLKDYGILFKHSAEDLAKKVQEIEDNSQLAQRYRERAPNRILEEYTWEHITDQYEDYLLRLVKGEKPALDLEIGMYQPKYVQVHSRGGTLISAKR